MKAYLQQNRGQKSYEIPPLRANGTMGGSSFACASKKGYSMTYDFFYFGSYGDVNLNFVGNWISWYYPQPTKLTFINIDFGAVPSGGMSGYIQASNDNSNWINLEPFYDDDNVLDGIEITITNPDFYSYYRILITSDISGFGSTFYLNSIIQYAQTDAYKIFKQENVCKYYKSQYTTFTRPNLSAKGELGGNAFAVGASGQYNSTYAIFKAVDGNNSTGWEVSSPTTAYYIFYNPDPLKLSSIKMRNWTGSGNIDASKGGKVYGSNDNSTWTELVTYTNTSYSSGAEWNIDMSSVSDAYTYYKITCTDGTSNNRNYWTIAEITPIGYYATYTESTIADYDIYRKVNLYHALDI